VYSTEDTTGEVVSTMAVEQESDLGRVKECVGVRESVYPIGKGKFLN
jgi:hypothetical protein